MNERPLSDNFDERFLSAFGLGDPDNPLQSSSSASITNNRETKLERQANESPWLVQKHACLDMYLNTGVRVYVCHESH